MKKKLPILIIIFLLVTTTIFYGLWLHEKYNQTDLKDLCQWGAASTVTSLSEFKETECESDYWCAVAEFRVFEQSYWKEQTSQPTTTFATRFMDILFFLQNIRRNMSTRSSMS